MRLIIAFVIIMAVAAFLAGMIHTTIGKGGFERMVKISGIYSVCQPDKYPVVCFLDADSKAGGLYCMPLSQAGGVCQ